VAAAGAWELHDLAKQKMLTGLIDFDSDSFVCRLYTSASDIGTVANNDASTATNELGTANGYTAGGTAITCSVDETSGIVSVNFTDANWSASGAGITARFAAVIDTTLTPDEIVAHCLVDATPADATAAAGNQFIVQFHANGMFQFV
jgi:hypothetical protein